MSAPATSVWLKAKDYKWSVLEGNQVLIWKIKDCEYKEIQFQQPDFVKVSIGVQIDSLETIGFQFLLENTS